MRVTGGGAVRLFVYEHITATLPPGLPPSPLHPLGLAMRDAVVADFARVRGVDVKTLADGEAATGEGSFLKAVAETDRQLVIAPETGGILARLSRLVREAGGHPLGASVGAIELASDKLRLAEHWRDNGVPTPPTSGREPTVCEVFPVVWKPRDGAGAVATFRLDRPTDVARCRAVREAEGHAGDMIMQAFAPGRAASVAFLTGPGVAVPMAPTFQHVSDDGRFGYEGGELPIPPELAKRAVRLGRTAIGCVTGLSGWVAVDLVLGDAADGSADYAIELNPRLSVSYVGVRALADFNVAAAMVRAADGESVDVAWRAGRVRFGAGGTVAISPA